MFFKEIPIISNINLQFIANDQIILEILQNVFNFKDGISKEIKLTENKFQGEIL